MTRTLVAIFADPHGWHLGYTDGVDVTVVGVAGTVGDDVAADAVALAVRRAVDQLGLSFIAPVLGLPSAWCLAARIRLDDLPKKQRRQAMTYRLEEQLPIDAEQLVADFIESSDPSSVSKAALGVTCAPAQLAPLLDALAEHGLTVGIICPTAILTPGSGPAPGSDPGSAPGNSSRNTSGDGEHHLIILQHGAALDLLETTRGVCTAWHICPAGPTALRRQLQLSLLHDPDRHIAAIGLDESLSEVLDQFEHQVDIASPEHDVLMSATGAARTIAIDGARPPLNLRRDALAPRDRLYALQRPLHFAVAAAVALMLALTVTCLVRSYRYDKLTAQLDDQQATLFREAFPRQSPPEGGGIVSRLRSETRKLEGTSGQTAELPTRTSAAHLLHQTLSGLPKNLRFRVLELRLDGQRLYLDGQTRSHSDAEAIAASLRKTAPTSGGFVIEPPRTENLQDKGVAFTLTGSQPGGGGR